MARAEPWREAITRGARLICLSPLVALGVAPFAVFFRPVLIVLLGVAIVLASVAGGLASLWSSDPDLTPGDMRSAILFALLCFNGSIFLILRKRTPETLRWVVVGAGITHIPVWWLLVFPTQFDASAWKSSGRGSSQQDDMAEDLVYSRILLGKTQSEVVELLGSPGSYRGPNQQFFELNRGTCKGFMLTFDGEAVAKADFYWCL